MVSPEDIEAIDILITQRRNEEASLDKEIKEEPVLKDGKQMALVTEPLEVGQTRQMQQIPKKANNTRKEFAES